MGPNHRMMRVGLSLYSSWKEQASGMGSQIVRDELELEPPHTAGDGSLLALAAALMVLLGFIANWAGSL